VVKKRTTHVPKHIIVRKRRKLRTLRHDLSDSEELVDLGLEDVDLGRAPAPVRVSVRAAAFGVGVFGAGSYEEEGRGLVSTKKSNDKK
jgi:hypothetical protein